MSWERVHTVNGFYDSPRLGVADYRGKPHIYQSEFSEAEDDYSDRFWLMPIDQQLFDLVMQAWAIWLRWNKAFQAGTTAIDTHPSLPEDRKRHDELKQAIGDRLHADPNRSLVKNARFRSTAEGDLQVEWTDDPNSIASHG
jgi:hypothetical protein